MAGFQYNYDSQAVRAAAQRVRECLNTLEHGASPTLKTVRGEVASNLKGEAANALTQRLNDLSGDIGAVSGSLSGLYRALISYAEALERTERELRAKMGR